MNKQWAIPLFMSMLICSCGTEKLKPLRLEEESAKKIIEEKFLGNYKLLPAEAKPDSLYTLVSLKDINAHGFNDVFLRRSENYYFFQDGSLIYKNKKDDYYQGRSILEKEHNFYSSQKTRLHSFYARSASPVFILIHHKAKRKIEDLITFDSYSIKQDDDLRELGLPLIAINSFGNAISDKKYIVSNLTTNEASHSVKMKVRGSSSKSFPKKQLGIKSKEGFKLRGELYTKAVLYSPYCDRSLLRNKLAYDLFAALRSESYQSTYCNVVINDTYEGLSLMIDHPKVQFKKRHVDSNAFLVQINRGPWDIVHESIHDDYIDNNYILEVSNEKSNHRLSKVDSVITDFEISLNRNDLSKIHLEEFVDLVIINELSKNIDAYRLSTYLDYDGFKMGVGPIWDYNIAWGLADHADGTNASGFVIESPESKYAPYWWQQLWQHKDFKTKLKERYSELRASSLHLDSIYAHIDNITGSIQSSSELNFKKWDLFDKPIWPSKQKPKSYSEELDIMKLWIKDRLIWLDQQWLETKP